MKIYINDIPVKIKKYKKRDEDFFDMILDIPREEVKPSKLKGHVLLRNKSEEAIDLLLKIMTSKKYKKIKSILIEVKDKLKAEDYLLSKFKVVHAAGGIVEQDGKILMILRNGLWDIPKGKLEKKESKREGAIREVEEETGVKVEIMQRICSTWHTYIRNKKHVLKNTFWYQMNCLDDSGIAPQKSENIEKVIWMNESEVDLAMHHSYETIKRLIKRYRKNNKKLTQSS